MINIALIRSSVLTILVFAFKYWVWCPTGSSRWWRDIWRVCWHFLTDTLSIVFRLKDQNSTPELTGVKRTNIPLQLFSTSALSVRVKSGNSGVECNKNISLDIRWELSLWRELGLPRGPGQRSQNNNKLSVNITTSTPPSVSRVCYARGDSARPVWNAEGFIQQVAVSQQLVNRVTFTEDLFWTGLSA